MEVANRTKKSKEWPAPTGLSGRMHHDSATINRILLGFRPIAPKPATDGSGLDNGKVTGLDSLKELKRRPKRKYVRVNKISGDGSGSGSGGRKCKSTAGKATEDDNRKDLRFDVDGAGVLSFQASEQRESSSPEESGSGANVMMRFGSIGMVNNDNPGLELGLGLGSADRAVETWVVVSGMTETAVVEGGGMVGSTDGEKMRSLDLDTCPGMISDGLHRVQWVNLAYKAMVDPAAAGEVAVRLVLKENIPAGLSAFACTARVVYTWRKEKYSKTMPCDVWRMEFGGFAWRLDTKAALCLGR